MAARQRATLLTHYRSFKKRRHLDRLSRLGDHAPLDEPARRHGGRRLAADSWRDAESRARLQGTAEPNMVVIAESTRRLLGNLFELKDLGARDLKGIAGPVGAWAALRARAVVSRFEALHTTGLTA